MIRTLVRSLEIILIAAAMLDGGPALAAWSASGNVLGDAPESTYTSLPLACSDGAGGAFVTWAAHSTATSYDVRVQHVLANGVLAAGWTANGKTACGAPGIQMWPSIVADNSGGAYVAWFDYRDGDPDDPMHQPDIYLQHVTATSCPGPGWPASGVAVATGPGYQGPPLLAPDGSNGVYVGWLDDSEGPIGLRIQRFTVSGVPHGLWPPGGPPLGSPPDKGLAIAPDGAGGLFVGWLHEPPDYDYDVMLTRVTGSGAIAPGWSEAGVDLTPAPALRQLGLTMIPDGSNGLLLAWEDKPMSGSGTSQLRALDLDAAGAVKPGWPSGGLVIAERDAHSVTQFEFVPDGSGGALAAWLARRPDPSNEMVARGTHALASGEIAAGWPADGVTFIPRAGYQSQPCVAADGQGGGFFSVQVSNMGWVQHLGPGGSPSGNWPPEGAMVANNNPAWYPVVVPAGSGKAIAAWTWIGAGPSGGGVIYGRLLEDAAIVSVPAPSGALPAFALSVSPDPAAGPWQARFTLADPGDVTLAVVDVSGRRALSRELRGLARGEHRVAMGSSPALAPGVYFMTITQGDVSATRRMCIVR